MGRTEASAVVEGSWATSCPTCGEKLVPVLLPGESGRADVMPVVSAEVPIRMVCRACGPGPAGGADIT